MVWPACLIVVLLIAGMQTPLDQLSARDQDAQAAAVTAIATSCDGCEDELAELWGSTDRFDVKARIVQVFVEMGEAGLPGLMRLSRTRVVGDASDGTTSLLVRALARHGERGLDALVDDIDARPGGDAYLLERLIRYLDVPPDRYARRLLESDLAEARRIALRRLVRQLPVEARSAVVLRSMHDPDKDVRHVAVAEPALPVWSAAEQARSPDRFAEYVSGLHGLLDSNDESIVRSAFINLAANDALAPEMIHLLGAVARDPRREFWTRTEALRLFLVHSPDTRRAVGEAIALIDALPSGVCIALAAIDADLIGGDDIEAVVSVLGRARGREEEYAADLIVVRSFDRDRPRIGMRALPALIEALNDPDHDLSGHAASVIGSLGPEAATALPDLIEQLEVRGRGWRGKNYVDAMLAIAPDDPDDPDVRAALTAVILRHDADRYVAGNALRDLLELWPDAVWVRELARPVIESPAHPLHTFALHDPPAEIADLIESDQTRLIAEVIVATERDHAWAYANGTRSERVELRALIDERDRRMRAARAIQRIRDPSPLLVGALLTGLRSNVLEAPRPPRQLSFASDEDLKARMRAGLWEQERATAGEVARVVADVLDRRPDHFRRVINTLGEHPVALAFVLSSSVSDEAAKQLRPLRVPDDLPPDLISSATAALLASAGEVTPSRGRQAAIIGALGRIPTDDPRRTDVLIDLVRFGRGSDAPSAAMVGLGHTRPMTPELLRIIVTHFDDPRVSMRDAAFTAAGHAGDASIPLLDVMIEHGRRVLWSTTGSAVARAVERIAPDDPRVVAYLTDYRASLPPRRSVD